MGMNVTPNTAKKMMTYSPEQMQAMAYHQMMMQQQVQQMQMGQMQMAMALQAQAVAGGTFPSRPNNMMGGPNAKMIMGGHATGATSRSFSFLDNPTKQKDDKTFDFIKDAMKSEK